MHLSSLLKNLLPLSFLDTHSLCYFSVLCPDSSLLASCSFDQFIYFLPSSISRIIQVFFNRDIRGVYHFHEILSIEFEFKKFSRSSLILCFNFFLLSPLVWSCVLPIFPSICLFPFLRESLFFLDLVLIFLRLLVFFRFPLLIWHIFIFQILPYKLSVYSYCWY